MRGLLDADAAVVRAWVRPCTAGPSRGSGGRSGPRCTPRGAGPLLGGTAGAHLRPCRVPTSSAREAPELDAPGKERQERARVRMDSESLDEEES